MLNCKKVAHRASDYLDGELSLMMRLRVMLHLLICSACRRFLNQLALVKRLLGKQPQPTLSDEDIRRLVRVSQSALAQQK